MRSTMSGVFLGVFVVSLVVYTAAPNPWLFTSGLLAAAMFAMLESEEA